LCDVEQRLNTENINLMTQSSKESISLPHCVIFDQMFYFCCGYNVLKRQKNPTSAAKVSWWQNFCFFSG